MDVETLYEKYVNSEYDEAEINLYLKLNNKSSSISKWKKRIIGFSIILAFIKYFSTIWDFPLFFNIHTEQVSTWIVILWSIVIHMILSFLIHLIAYKQIGSFTSLYRYHLENQGHGKIITYILSHMLDYLSALHFKELIKNNYRDTHHCIGSCIIDKDGICIREWDKIRIKLKFFIEFSNWINFVVAFLLASLTILLWGLEGWIIDLIFCVIILRVVSRFLEIAIAFFNDVVKVNDKLFTNGGYKHGEAIYIHRWKNSLILKSGRISLAIHSLVEIIFLYSILYYYILLYFPNSHPENIFVPVLEWNIFSYLHFLLLSTATSFMNTSFREFAQLIWSVTHITQVLLSVILIILSITTYIGLDNEISNRDKEFYKRIELTNRKQFMQVIMRILMLKMIFSVSEDDKEKSRKK